MKRRNVDASKTRRPVKKIPKLYDGVYSHTLVVYVKLLLLWICVMGGDFLLEFRLEYLYPLYLLLHNTYEAYKFQGLAFALLLVCIVVSVDVICLGVVPAPWLYLLGSLAVWGQVGWSLTPLGPLLLLPTLIYIDGKSIRPLPSQPLSPLAAHCVGFPLVSLGFALKSLIGARLKQRTRNEVSRLNELLFSLLIEALPYTSPPVNNNEVISNGSAVLVKKQQQQLTSTVTATVSRRKSLENGETARELNGDVFTNNQHNHQTHTNGKHAGSSSSNTGNGGVNIPNSIGMTNSVPPGPASTSHSNSNNMNHSSGSSNSTQYATPCPVCAAALLAPKKKKDDCCFKLESEVRKLRSDLHSVRSVEADLRGQITSLLGSERNLRGDLASLQGEHESLQLKYSALVSKSQEERQSYEKKLLEERRQKENAINKQKKVSSECSGDCKRKLREAERDKEALRRDIKIMEDKSLRTERELQNVKSTLMHEQKNKESSAETARLMSLLSALQDQNAHLESNLSAETRLKLDLFSALGETRRQVAIRDSMIKSKEEELEELKSQYLELLSMTEYPQKSQQQRQQNLQLQQPSRMIGIGGPQQPQTSTSQLQQNHQLRLKGFNSSDTSSPSVGHENLSYSPLIES